MEDGRGNVDCADQAFRNRSLCGDPQWPEYHQRRFHATVVHPGLAPRERTAIVGHHDDDGLVEYPLPLKFGAYLSDEIIEPCNLVVIRDHVLTGFGGIGKPRRYLYVGRIVRYMEFVGTPRAMRVERSEPEEERLVGGPVLQERDPELRSAVAVFGIIAIGMEIERPVHLRSEVPFTGLCGVITTLLQQQGEWNFGGRKGGMQLGRPGGVRVFARDDAATAGTARTGSQEGIGELQSLAGQPIDVGGLHYRIAVASDVIPADVVGNDEHDVRPLTGLKRKGKSRTNAGGDPDGAVQE